MDPTADPVEAFINWRKREGLSLAKAGARFGVSAPTVQDWERRRKRPRDENRDLIQEVIGIDRNAWRNDAERARVKRLSPQIPVVRAKPTRKSPRKAESDNPRRAAS